ncbi:MAG: 4-hydroxy-tetrahydrodipicolinate reductase [Pseudomonadota bacterium]
MIKLMIVGACGRMGKEVMRAAAGADGLTIAAAVEHGSHPDLGKDAGLAAGAGGTGVKVSAGIAGALAGVDAVIDFSLPDSTMALLGALRDDPKPAIIATTGLGEDIMEAARAAASKSPVLLASNMSCGVAVLKHLTREALKFLAGFDVEIVESHHRGKADAPSGTAGDLLRILKQGLENQKLETEILHGRSGKLAKRKAGDIGVHAVRGGSVTGEHTVFFLGDGERIEIKHTAEHRGIFALGSLNAVRWLVKQPAGLYSMDDFVK